MISKVNPLPGLAVNVKSSQSELQILVMGSNHCGTNNKMERWTTKWSRKKLNTKNNFSKESTFFRKFVKTESNAGSLKKRMGSGRWCQDYKRIKKLHFHRFTLIDRSLSNWKVCFCCKANKNVFAEIKFFTFTFVGKLFFTFTFSICDSDNNRYQI